MKIYEVNSLPLKDVIMSLAKSMNTGFSNKCQEYWVNIPDDIGSGEIRGVNFDNGLGIISYHCKFYQDLRIEFTVDDIHPVKYLYSVDGKVTHTFANENHDHIIEKYRCAIVASKMRNGHILKFEKGIDLKLVSLEIDRQKFLDNTTCEIDSLIGELADLFTDTTAKKTFYHEGFYGLAFRNIFDNLDMYRERTLIRKFFLESITLNVFVNQIIQFEDDLLHEDNRQLLRQNEVETAMQLTEYIENNLGKKLSISNLSSQSGLNANKLQILFKHLFDKTVNNYITDRRLSKAAELLKKSDLNISEIAGRVGFDNNSYFSKIFKDRYSLSPSVFRR